MADNTKLFRKIVRDFNGKTGFNFQLPKDTDYTSKYAHPVHEDNDYKITSQIDDGKDGSRELYALRVVKDGVTFQIDSGMTYDELVKAMSHEAFKYRLGSLRQLMDLCNELQAKMNEIQVTLFDETVADIAKEENYDLAIKTARTLYKSAD